LRCDRFASSRIHSPLGHLPAASAV